MLHTSDWIEILDPFTMTGEEIPDPGCVGKERYIPLRQIGPFRA